MEGLVNAVSSSQSGLCFLAEEDRTSYAHISQSKCHDLQLADETSSLHPSPMAVCLNEPSMPYRGTQLIVQYQEPQSSPVVNLKRDWNLDPLNLQRSAHPA